ncbi:hypothetical protein G7Y89_g11742 [Cudoniella acicularis]|uniref:Lysine 2,3-aminomutase n=1 Tax=Cudoniella acicularis TaxID=354080 RepID=A0A8H4RAA3_9HELO|nr:hypothetical protein G7Y89_g11742 [Cudoniella acicularis]
MSRFLTHARWNQGTKNATLLIFNHNLTRPQIKSSAISIPNITLQSFRTKSPQAQASVSHDAIDSNSTSQDFSSPPFPLSPPVQKQPILVVDELSWCIPNPPLNTGTPVYHHGIKLVQGAHKLPQFLQETLPSILPTHPDYPHLNTREAFITDVLEGIKAAPMSIRLTPHILSLVNWQNPLEDPLLKQFLPIKSTFLPDHPKLSLDSLHESLDSPCAGLVHRYPDKVLFLVTSVCPLYCRFCTRSYAVGGNTEVVTKTPAKPLLKRWNEALDYITRTPAVQDVVVSGGDGYYLEPNQLRYIGERLLAIPHVRRFRIASKGLGVAPSRILDPNDQWTDELITLSKMARAMGKQIALHTHLNHKSEFSWVTLCVAV